MVERAGCKEYGRMVGDQHGRMRANEGKRIELVSPRVSADRNGKDEQESVFGTDQAVWLAGPAQVEVLDVSEPICCCVEANEGFGEWGF